ncbi:MAG TPA: hypothetical protein VHM88_24700, partial [Candidatus Acidoferrales bacterium]|nr:hypothetical protein [Candidatus Acidoferrales bacterium]
MFEGSIGSLELVAKCFHARLQNILGQRPSHLSRTWCVSLPGTTSTTYSKSKRSSRAVTSSRYFLTSKTSNHAS